MPQIITSDNKRELFSIAKKGARIRSSLNLDTTALTPVNFQEEKVKFFKSRIYNPKYKYNPPPDKRFDLEIDELEQRVEKINLPYDLLYHLIEYLNHLRFLYHARHSIGRDTFPVYAKLAYDWEITDPDELLKSLPEFKFKNEERGKLMKAPQIAEELQKVMAEKYKIPDFSVKVNNFSRNMIFVDFDVIRIGHEIKRFKNNVKRLVVHEVESHVIQNYNIRKSENLLRILSKLSDSNLYSEGLGVYNEVMTGTLTKKSFQNYYYRLKSVKNYHLSFRKIYEMLLNDGLSEKHAFNIAYRVKRGMYDTSKPGGYPKDSAYLLGYKAVLEFLKDNPEKIMYYAKNPHLTKLLMKYNLIKKDNILYPKFVNA